MNFDQPNKEGSQSSNQPGDNFTQERKEIEERAESERKMFPTIAVNSPEYKAFYQASFSAREKLKKGESVQLTSEEAKALFRVIELGNINDRRRNALENLERRIEESSSETK